MNKAAEGRPSPANFFQENKASEGRRSNFCKDHRDKIEVPDPLVVENLISDYLLLTGFEVRTVSYDRVFSRSLMAQARGP